MLEEHIAVVVVVVVAVAGVVGAGFVAGAVGSEQQSNKNCAVVYPVRQPQGWRCQAALSALSLVQSSLRESFKNVMWFRVSREYFAGSR